MGFFSGDCSRDVVYIRIVESVGMLLTHQDDWCKPGWSDSGVALVLRVGENLHMRGWEEWQEEHITWREQQLGKAQRGEPSSCSQGRTESEDRDSWEAGKSLDRQPEE